MPSPSRLAAVALGAVCAAATLTGCGSSSPSSDPAASAGSSGKVFGPTAAQLASTLPCKVDPSDPPTDVSCSFAGSFVGLKSYTSKAQLDAYAAAARANVPVLVGENFVLDAPDVATLRAAQAVLGGDVQGD